MPFVDESIVFCRPRCVVAFFRIPTPRGPLRRRRRDNPSDRTTNLKKKHLHLRYVCMIQTQGHGFDLPA